MIWAVSRRPALSLVSRAEFLKLWDLTKPVAREPWNRSQGPLARAVLCLKGAGWRANGPFKWFDHNGLE
eukprot:7878965-Pyramimonas_sp.AAC.1